MVFGRVGREHLPLNEDTLTSREPPADLRTIDVTTDFAHVTGLIKAGKIPRPRPTSPKTGSGVTSSVTSLSATCGSISHLPPTRPPP